MWNPFAPSARDLSPSEMIEGESVRMGGRDYIVAPLNFTSLELLMPKIAALRMPENGMPSAKDFGAMVDVVHAALIRNYPRMSRKEVKSMLDMRNFRKVLQATLGVSGLEEVKTAPGEIRAPSSGATSTQNLQQPSDGLGSTLAPT